MIKFMIIKKAHQYLPKYSTFRVLLPFVGEADEASALGNRCHCVTILKAKHPGTSCHQNATWRQVSGTVIRICVEVMCHKPLSRKSAVCNKIGPLLSSFNSQWVHGWTRELWKVSVESMLVFSTSGLFLWIAKSCKVTPTCSGWTN